MVEPPHDKGFMSPPALCKDGVGYAGEMAKLLRLSSMILAFAVVSAQAQILDPLDTGPMTLPPSQQRPAMRPGPYPPPPQQGVPRMLDDTPEYCAELRDDITRVRMHRGGLPPDVAALASEGEQLCQIGHIRPGVYRLRTALMMLRQHR
jgi:hypothetical protein